MDYNFTATVEGTFDKIAEGEEKWNEGIARFYGTFHPDVQKVSNLRLEHKVGERILGNDPKTGKPVSVKIGRFGPVVQLGSAEADEKPQFASLKKEQSINTITLEEAMKLFDLPRDLGEFEGAVVTVAVGRFGPYIKHDGKFVSIPKGYAPETITLEEAQQLIVEKRDSEAKKVLRTFDEEPELEVLNGRFGVYIAYKKKNYKIPKGVDIEALTLADCLKIVEDDGNAPKKKVVRRKAATAKKK
jgi:DNA topoisomerase-1